MIRVIYQQTHNRIRKVIFGKTRDMFCQTECEDCGGTGIFMVPDGIIGVTYHWPENPCPEKPWPCVQCKGTGKLDVTLY